MADSFCQPVFFLVIAIRCINGIRSAYNRTASVQVTAYLLNACISPFSYTNIGLGLTDFR
jgi:hypothetical protein